MLEEDENPETTVCWWLVPLPEEGKGVPNLPLPTTPSQRHQVQVGSDAVGLCSSGRK